MNLVKLRKDLMATGRKLAHEIVYNQKLSTKRRAHYLDRLCFVQHALGGYGIDRAMGPNVSAGTRKPKKKIKKK